MPGREQAWKSIDVIAVQMRDGNGINLLAVYAKFLESHLRTLAAIQEVAISAHMEDLGRRVVLRQWYRRTAA